MGGSAFPLSTPRMPPAVYDAVRDQCIQALHALYEVVVTPVPGPDKKDHGDIDILVACPTAKTAADSQRTINEAEPDKDALDEIISVLGGVMSYKTKAKDGWSCNVAIPWPEHLLPTDTSTSDTASSELAVSTSPDTNGGDSISEAKKAPGGLNPKPEIPGVFIQVDTRICQNLQDLRWRKFKHAHGDIWNLLGTIIRPYGLTADEVGLHIRIPEVERINNKGSRVLLTSDPGDVLEFLGLDDYPGTTEDEDLNRQTDAIDGAAEGYKGRNILTGRLHDKPVWETPFPSGLEMFEYVTKCRMFWLEPEMPPSSPTDAAPDSGSKSPETEASPDGRKKGPSVSQYPLENTSAPVRENLKHNDRRRVAQRPMYKKWMDKFLPALRQQLAEHLKAQQGEKTSEPISDSASPLGLSDPKKPSLVAPFPYPISRRCTRRSTRLDVFASFPESRTRYYAALRARLSEERTIAIKRGLKDGGWIQFPADASTQFQGDTRGAFRRILFDGSRDFGVTLEDVEDGFPLTEVVVDEQENEGNMREGGKEEKEEGVVWIEENVKRFVQRHWREVGERAERFYHGIVQARMAERMRKAREVEDDATQSRTSEAGPGIPAAAVLADTANIPGLDPTEAMATDHDSDAETKKRKASSELDLGTCGTAAPV